MCIYYFWNKEKEACSKAAQWFTCYIKSVHNILRKKLTCLGNSKKTWQHVSFHSYIGMYLSHANQMQCMALFRSWSKQTNCQNIYKQVRKFEFWLDIWWYKGSIIIMTYAKCMTVMLGKKNPYLLGKHIDIIMDEMIWSLGFYR